MSSYQSLSIKSFSACEMYLTYWLGKQKIIWKTFVSQPNIYKVNTASQRVDCLVIFEPGFDLSFLSTVVKSYLFAALFWMNKNENI